MQPLSRVVRCFVIACCVYAAAVPAAAPADAQVVSFTTEGAGVLHAAPGRSRSRSAPSTCGAGARSRQLGARRRWPECPAVRAAPASARIARACDRQAHRPRCGDAAGRAPACEAVKSRMAAGCAGALGSLDARHARCGPVADGPAGSAPRERVVAPGDRRRRCVCAGPSPPIPMTSGSCTRVRHTDMMSAAAGAASPVHPSALPGAATRPRGPRRTGWRR